MAVEFGAVPSKEILGLEILLPELLGLGGLVDRGKPHLVAHEDQEVRLLRQLGLGRLGGLGGRGPGAQPSLEKSERARGRGAALKETAPAEVRGGVIGHG